MFKKLILETALDLLIKVLEEKKDSKIISFLFADEMQNKVGIAFSLYSKVASELED